MHCFLCAPLSTGSSFNPFLIYPWCLCAFAKSLKEGTTKKRCPVILCFSCFHQTSKCDIFFLCIVQLSFIYYRLTLFIWEVVAVSRTRDEEKTHIYRQSTHCLWMWAMFSVTSHCARVIPQSSATLVFHRAAAKSNKGVEVVCCVALKSFITVMVRVLRGPAAANRCVRKIRRVIHCCVCEDRAFYPETVYPIGECPSWMNPLLFLLLRYVTG